MAQDKGFGEELKDPAKLGGSDQQRSTSRSGYVAPAGGVNNDDEASAKVSGRIQRAGKMSDVELKAVLQAEKYDALGSIKASHLSLDRAQAMKYYLGDMTDDMPTIEGRSTAVSTDVADSIEGLLPALLGIFCGSEDVVRFDPVNPDDEQQAEQESDYVNHVFMNVNQGFMVLYHMIKDALLSKVGIVKVWWEERDLESKETYYNQSDDAYALLLSDEEAEIVEHTEHQDPLIGTTHDVTVVRPKKEAYAHVEPVPPEEFGISRRARVDMQSTGYMFHEVVSTQAKLLDQGFDFDTIDRLMTYADIPHAGAASEIYARDTVFEYSERDGDENINRANRPIRVTEHYIKLDYEGDGKTRLYRITTGGEDTEILTRDGEPDIVEVEWFPFAAITPFIQTHRFFGRSIADVTMDIQRIKTAVTRGVLDSVYLANNARIEVPDGAVGPNTLDDLLTSRPGGIIRTKQPGQLREITSHFVGDSAFPVLQYFDQVREWRTGVSRVGQGVAPDALQNTPATNAMIQDTAARERSTLIAKNFAETGIKDLFWLLHSTIRKYGGKAETIRLRNNWVTVDPRQWKARDQITVHVGLGSGGKAQQSAMINQLMLVQEKLLTQGGQMIVSPKNVYQACAKLCNLAGFKDPEMFFTDPKDADWPPPAPDPKMQIEQQKAQAEAANDQRAAQVQQANDERQAQLDHLQAQKDMQVQAQKAQTEAQLAREKFEFDKQLKLMEFELKTKQAEHGANLKNTEQAISVFTDGAALGSLGKELGKHSAAIHEELKEHKKLLTAKRKTKIVKNKDGSKEAISEIVP